MARGDSFTAVYDHSDAAFNLKSSLSSLINDDFWKSSEVKLQRSSLSSNRYLSDFSFSKDATFFHNIKNSENQPVDVITHDYFIESLKPYLHEIKIFQRHLDTGVVAEIPR